MSQNQIYDFEQLCTPYINMIYRHCYIMLKRKEDAEDATQECLIKAYRAFNRYNGRGVASWLFRIAHNICLDILKSARYKKESLSLSEVENTKYTEVSPDTEYERKSFKEQVRNFLQLLSPDDQLLLLLAYTEELSYAEIAESTGLKLGTVKSRLNRAKTNLKKVGGSFFVDEE